MITRYFCDRCNTNSARLLLRTLPPPPYTDRKPRSNTLPEGSLMASIWLLPDMHQRLYKNKSTPPFFVGQPPCKTKKTLRPSQRLALCVCAATHLRDTRANGNVSSPFRLGSLPHVHVRPGPENLAFVDLFPLYPSVPVADTTRTSPGTCVSESKQQLRGDN